MAIGTIKKTFFYKSGIWSNPECQGEGSSNHAVLVVGYGSDNGNDYWLIKNSWGTGWGENGYLRLARNRNMCGVAKYASYPVVG